VIGVIDLVLERGRSAAGWSRVEFLFGAGVADSIWCKIGRDEGIRRCAREKGED
jgi:hypothetical protein